MPRNYATVATWPLSWADTHYTFTAIAILNSDDTKRDAKASCLLEYISKKSITLRTNYIDAPAAMVVGCGRIV